MAVVPLQKVGIVVHRDDMRKLAKKLGEMGIVQVSHHEREQTLSGREIEEKLSRLERTLSFLVDVLGKEPSTKTFTIDELSSLVRDFDLDRELDKIDQKRAELDNLKSSKNNILQLIDTIKPYEAFDAPLESVADTQNVGMKLGFLPKDSELALLDENGKPSLLFHFIEFNRDANGTFLLLIYHRSLEQDVEKMLEGRNFAELHIRGLKGKPLKIISEKSLELTRIEREIIERETELKKIAVEIAPILKALNGYYSAELAELQLGDLAEKTERTFYLDGWIKKKDFPALKSRLEKELDAVDVQQINPREGELPPIALSNPPIIEAFEVITDLYGRPRVGMLDPTPFIATFFPIYFGLCLTDAGYGTLLALVAGFFLVRKGTGEGAKKFMRMLLFAGIATIILGALAGGWFGLDIVGSQKPIAKALHKIKIFDPLNDALLFFAISVMLGVLHITIGYICSGFIAAKEQPNKILKLRSILISLSWVAVTFGAGITISNFLVPDVVARFVPLSSKLLLFGAGGIVVFSIFLGIPGGRGIGGSLNDGLAFSGLYGVISLFADLLSYARILALGLSSGVIASVINIISKQINELIPGIGIVLAVIIAVLAHIGFAAISSIGAFVHPARLNFVEFFTKFYEAGGEPFKPFKRNIEGVKIGEKTR